MKSLRQLCKSAPAWLRRQRTWTVAEAGVEAYNPIKAVRSVEVPLDMVAMIMQQLEFPDLARCAVTCKAYREEAERRLYRSIDFRIIRRIMGRAEGREVLVFNGGFEWSVDAVALSAVKQRVHHIEQLDLASGHFDRPISVLLQIGMEPFTKLQSVKLPLGNVGQCLTGSELTRLQPFFTGRELPVFHLRVMQHHRRDRPETPFPDGWCLARFAGSSVREVHLSLLSEDAGQPRHPAAYLATLLGYQPKLERLTITTVSDDCFFRRDPARTLREATSYAQSMRQVIVGLLTGAAAGRAVDCHAGDAAERHCFPALREVVIQVPQSAFAKDRRKDGYSTWDNRRITWLTSRDSLHAHLMVHLEDLVSERRGGEGEALLSQETGSQPGRRPQIEVQLVPV